MAQQVILSQIQAATCLLAVAAMSVMPLVLLAALRRCETNNSDSQTNGKGRHLVPANLEP